MNGKNAFKFCIEMKLLLSLITAATTLTLVEADEGIEFEGNVNQKEIYIHKYICFHLKICA